MITDINQLDLTKRYTYADYLLWKFSERVELIKGHISKMSPAPSTKHQEVSRELFLAIGVMFKKQPCKVFSAPFDVRLSKKKKDQLVETVVQPDICVICDLSKLDDRGCIGAPDLVVEILSPSTRKKDITDKYNIYEENGVKEYWIVDPDSQTVLKYILQNKKYVGEKILDVSESITSTVFPDLTIVLSEVFED
ncbi:MAG: Uma2 family endonuclease [Flavobacteriaceae bacterium]